jgi:hypothetical protein
MKGLKIILWISAIACILSFIAMFIPFRFLASWSAFFGLKVPATAVTAYITRLCMACFGLMGVFLVILARDPLTYGPMVSLAGYGAIFLGLVCLAWGLRYQFPPLAFYGDVVFCIVAGALILLFQTKAIAEQKTRQAE